MIYARLLFITSETLVTSNGRIRPCLSIDSTKTLVHVLVMSRLDHCNSLLYGLPDYPIQRLQYVMNAAAKVITCKRAHRYLLSYTGSPSVNVLFLRF